MHPADDGIFKINGETKEKTLLVSYRQLADALRDTRACGSSADGGGEHDLSIRGDIVGFDHGPMHRTQNSVAQRLRALGYVQVEEVSLAGFRQPLQTLAGTARRSE